MSKIKTTPPFKNKNKIITIIWILSITVSSLTGFTLAKTHTFTTNKPTIKTTPDLNPCLQIKPIENHNSL